MIQFNKTIFQFTRRFALVIMLLGISNAMWAGASDFIQQKHDTHEATITIQVQIDGEDAVGKVYADQDNLSPVYKDSPAQFPIYATQTIVEPSKSIAEKIALYAYLIFFSGEELGYKYTQTAYIHTEAIDGYLFQGWYLRDGDNLTEIKDANGIHITNTSFETSISIADGDNNKTDDKIYVAKWLKPKVTVAGNDLTFTPEITNITQLPEGFNAPQYATYTVADFKTTNDFTSSLITDNITDKTKGFQKAETETDKIENNIYSMPITYVPTGVHGTITGRAILKVELCKNKNEDELADNEWKYVTLTATENYTPNFTAKDSYNFGTVSLGTPRPSNSDLYPVTNNYAADAATTTNKISGTVWEYDVIPIEGQPDYSQYFTITKETKEPQVTFNPGSTNVFGLGNTDGTNTKDISALLQMKCTYYDAAGKALSTDYQYTTLNATVKRDLTSRLSFLNNQETCNLEEITMGDNTQKVELVLDYANVSFGDNACQLNEDNVLFALPSEKPNGSIVTITIPDTESFDGCKEYTDTLTVTGTSTLPEENNKLLSCQITLKATLVWGDAPVVTGAGTNKKVTFTWNEIPGAKSYQVYATTPGGNTLEPKGDPIPAGGTMKYEVTTEKNEDSYAVKCYVVAINSKDCSITSNESTAIPALDWIDKENMASTGLKTGIAGGYTASGLPADNQTNRDIVLTAAFDAEGMPIMDKLYVFGETTGSESTITTSNAITPLSVYTKVTDKQTLEELGKTNPGYKLEHIGSENYTVKNVIDERASQLSISLESSETAIYFTGYCPLAKTGTETNNGAVFINGVSKNIDIYFEDCQIYAGDNSLKKTYNKDNAGELVGKSRINAEGSGSVFIFDVNACDIKLHMSKNNVLKAGEGSKYNINLNDLKDEPTHHCAPIKILASSANNTATMSIDDLWGKTRTHGSLSLIGSHNDALSLDLGNSNTNLIIDGGKLTLNTIAAGYQSVSYEVAAGQYVYLLGVQSDNYESINNCISNIHLKDGTFLSSSSTEWYATSMYVDGGSYRKEPLNYTTDKVITDNTSNPVAIRNSDQKILRYTTIDDIEINNYGSISEDPKDNGRCIISNFDQMVDAQFPHCGVDDAKNAGYHMVLSAYYAEQKTPQYGTTNLFLDSEGSLSLMLPKLECTDINIAWQMCSPDLSLKTTDGKKTKLGGGITFAAGCKTHESEYNVDRLLHMTMDTYTQSALGSGYLPGIYTGGATLALEDKDMTPFYETIDNDTEYKIRKKVYMLMPIVADEWMLFSAPFDVANVYIIESYPEAQILQDFRTLHGMIHPDDVLAARKAQAERMLDLYAIWYTAIKDFGANMDFFGDTQEDGKDTYSAFVNTWIEYESRRGQGNVALDNPNAAYTPDICRLIHFNGTNANQAHYFLYEQDGDWEYTEATNEGEEAKFKTSWIPVAATPSATPNSTQAIMTKGNVYAMQFPYNIIGGTHDPEKQWDYWTGKYLLIESTLKSGADDENKHIISGSNFKTSGLFNDNVGSGKAKLCGNATFAELSGISAPTGTSLWTLTKDANQEIDVKVPSEDGDSIIVTVTRDVHKFTPMDTDEILAPGQGIVVANFTVPKSMRAISINYRTGEVEYVKIEDENPDGNNPGLGSGVPTIMGDLSLMVVPTSEGLTITPLKEQHVMLFDAEGKMIFSKYMSEEESVSLPTGVYVVRGEYEQVKAIKK